MSDKSENIETIKYMFLKYGYKYLDKDRIEELLLTEKEFLTEEVIKKYREEDFNLFRTNYKDDNKMVFCTF